MKRKLAMLMIAALGFGATSCSQDTEQQPQGDTARVSFKVSTPKPPLTLTRAIASQDEWNIASLDIYAAVDGEVEKLAADEFTISPALSNTPNQTYTITLNEAWLNANGGETVNFYMVANDASSTNGAHTSLAETDETEFVNSLTEALTTGGDGTLSPIVHPDGSAHNLLFSADIPDVLIQGWVQEICQLKRREARFDIQNMTYAAGDDQLIITGIEVINAPEAGLVFGAGDAAVQDTISRTNNIELPGLDPATDYTETAPGSLIAGDLATSVFYLYPTTLVSPGEAAPADKTQIVVTGTYEGETVKYPVDVAIDTPINANYRYILNVDATTSTITLTGADYEDGDTVETEPGGVNSAKASITPEIAEITGSGFYSTTSSLGNVFAAVDASVKSTMPFTAVSELGTTYTLLPAGTEVRLTKEVSQEPLTRAGEVVTTEVFTVMVPAGKEELEAMLILDSGKDREGNELGADTIHIRRLVPNIVGATAPYLIYKDTATEALQLGKWDAAQVTQANIASFRFGGVVGTDMITATYAASAVTFNPMADSTAVNDTWTSVPNFVAADYDAGVRNISDATYHTYENIALGKGDPCKLIGLTEDQIKQGLIDNKRFRMPTAQENIAFAGGNSPAELGWQPGDADIRYTHSTTPDNIGSFNFIDNTNNGVWFPVLDDGTLNTDGYFLPFAGYRDSGAGTIQMAAKDVTMRGRIWSSSESITFRTIAFAFDNKTAYPVYDNPTGSSFVVRCVPVNYVAPKPEVKAIEVGGVEWAPTNVAMPDRFMAIPEGTSPYYQWGQNTPWSYADPRVNMITGTEDAWPTGVFTNPNAETWSEATDPCPDGWRVPLLTEFSVLSDVERVSKAWVPAASAAPSGATYLDAGYEFKDLVTNAILFIPALGSRAAATGNVGGRGAVGLYWMGTTVGTTNGNTFSFASSGMNAGGNDPYDTGFSVRCVKDVDAPPFVTAYALLDDTDLGYGTGWNAELIADGVNLSVNGGSGLDNSSATVNIGDTATFTANASAAAGAKYAFSHWTVVAGDPLTYEQAIDPTLELTINKTTMLKAEYYFRLASTTTAAPASATIEMSDGYVVWAGSNLDGVPARGAAGSDNYKYDGANYVAGQDGIDDAVPGYTTAGGGTLLNVRTSLQDAAMTTAVNDIYRHGYCFAANATNDSALFQWGWSIAIPSVNPLYPTIAPLNSNAAPDNTWGANGVKTQYDPCPYGWRVPTAQEVADLINAPIAGGNGNSNGTYTEVSWATGFGAGTGVTITPKEGSGVLIIPNNGMRTGVAPYTPGQAYNRGTEANIWSSAPSTDNAWRVNFAGIYTSGRLNNGDPKLSSFSVRCVRSID